MANKKIVGGSILLFFFLLLVVGAGAFFLIGPGGGAIGGIPKYWYECNVVVKEELIGKEVHLESVSCSNTGSVCGYIFGFMTAEGTVEMWDSNGKIASKDYETGLTSGEDKITIRGCTVESGVRIRLYDEDHNFVEEKEG